MYTFCPECYTIFEIKAAHLAAADGIASCGKCHYIYRAIDYIYEDTVTARHKAENYRRKHQQAAAETQPVIKTMRATFPAAPSSETASRSDDLREFMSAKSRPGSDAGRAFEDKSATGQAAGTHGYKKAVSLNDVVGGAAIGILILLLAFQGLYFNRASLPADNWRVMIDRVCTVLGCEPVMQVDVSKIRLVSREVRRHPRVKDGLLINATLVNQAEFSQAYPIFEITFTGLAGNPVAMRRFQPAEYLGESASLQYGMPVGLPIQVIFEVVAPGDADDELSFQFTFI